MKAIVVGAGAVGLSVGEELARRGISVTIFEKGSKVGQESSWAAAGILSPPGEAQGPGPFLDLLLAGYQLIPETVRRLEAATGIDIRYKANGMLTVALTDEDERGLEGEAVWQNAAGLRCERISGSQVRAMEPSLDGAIRCALWSSQTVQLDNTKLVEAYEKAVRSLGVSVRTATPVVRFLQEGDRVNGVEISSGRVEADWVVDCAGAWAGFDTLLPFSIPTMPVRGQILQFRTTGPLFERVVMSPRAYFVQRTPDVLLAGTTVEQAGFDKQVTSEGKRHIMEGSRELFSKLTALPLETSWAGLRPGTPDGLPILGATPLRRFLIAAGHFRNGILLAPLTGRLIADLMTKGVSPIDLAPFGVERFSACLAGRPRR